MQCKKFGKSVERVTRPVEAGGLLVKNTNKGGEKAIYFLASAIVETTKKNAESFLPKDDIVTEKIFKYFTGQIMSFFGRSFFGVLDTGKDLKNNLNTKGVFNTGAIGH